MKLVKRMEVLEKLSDWLRADDEDLKKLRKQAYINNQWFTEEFAAHRIGNIESSFLDTEKLNEWVTHYHIDDNIEPWKIGIVMAGNIPLVGFHDFLCSFICGHYSYIKLSEKDSVLMKGIVEKMKQFDQEVEKYVVFADMLKGCDAYIATGSNNTSRYFEYYFGKYPSIIRKNRTSVAILRGDENAEELSLLADDIFLYFGLGCMNVTQLYVPKDFDFIRLLNALGKYEYLKDHVKFRNNYDYNLALLIMNNRQYMSNECIVMVEGDHLFSPVSELYYSVYNDMENLQKDLENNSSVQCIVSKDNIAFGGSQNTGLYDYADGVDTMQFLLSL